ncbi:OmcA/MtrC family decaheme c-type cytochrome [Shewanella sp. MSW]|uniref:OmcA/MtrC family decaheme c-type cytochrome n=1 Tax=Shewanella sp. MSW TaxID=2569536 RepID=UPI00118671B0|nr:OmcA/MtrC family decaheme c-type cytochrome [Shewanella sp. MSW]TVP08739.1 cytochrome C [Shewanella sp. MSW]
MMKFKPKNAWWKLSPLVVCLLAACSDGDDGQVGPPGEVGINIAKAKSLQANIEAVTIDEQTRVSVDFFLSDSNGVAVTGLEQLEQVSALAMGIAKLGSAQPMYGDSKPAEGRYAISRAPQWISYINKLVEPGTGATAQAAAQWQAGIESDCKLDCLQSLGQGRYRYQFSKALNQYPSFEGLDTQYESDKTHRVYLELKPAADSSPSSMLINSVYDFIPATGQAAAAEDSRVLMDQQQACYRCHGSDRDNSEARLLMHGSKRFAFEGCVMCHTSYSGDPETGSALDMATLTHKVHQGDYKVVGYRGHEYDYSQLHYPGDINDCKSCHIPDAAPQASQYFIPGSNSCLSCHSKDAPDDWNGSASALFHDRELFPRGWQQSCSGCHPDASNPEGAGKIHLSLGRTSKLIKQEYAFALSSAAIDGDKLNIGLDFRSQGRLPADDPAIESLWLTVSGDPEPLNRPLNNGQRKIWNLANPGDDVTLAMQGHSLNAAIGPLQIADFGEPDKTQVRAKLVVCADPNTGFAVACDTSSTRIEVIAANPLSLIGAPASSKAIADETACQRCHDNDMQQRVVSAHTLASHFQPGNDSCGSCHAPQGATALTDKSCNDCHNNDTNMYLNAGLKHTPGMDQIKAVRTLNNSLNYREMVHSLHSGTRTVTGMGGDRETATYPKPANDCRACHSKGQLTLDGLSQSASVLVATPGATEKGQIAEYSPTVAACGGCHVQVDDWASHAEAFGGVFQKDASGGPVYLSGSESCAICHAEGRNNGVDKVHGLGD